MRYAVLICPILITCLGCSGGSEQTRLAYNALGRGQHLDLVTEGYIIGIEKYKRDAIGAPESGDPDRLREKDNSTNDALIAEENREFVGATNDKKAMVVTQIASYFPHRKYIYNAYAQDLDGDICYDLGYDGLDNFREDLRARLGAAIRESRPYSHIFIMSMGWNNDQYVSVYRYNRIMEHLSCIAEKKGDSTFRPLVVGITWPSAWFTIEDNWLKKKIIGHIGSYTNKSNDADEIGYSIGNWLINVQLPQIRELLEPERFPKVVAVGHSLGARLLSRAIFSQDHLKETPPDPEVNAVDIFIGLQGAFSARRFVAADSGEGAPYRDYTALSTRIVLTSSENDRANPVAFWSRHVGGKNGLRYMEGHPEIFTVLVWPKDAEDVRRADVRRALQGYRENGRIITLDVTEIVTGRGAHNDILDAEIAELIWDCLQAVS
jgi:hypothetical protein